MGHTQPPGICKASVGKQEALRLIWHEFELWIWGTHGQCLGRGTRRTCQLPRWAEDVSNLIDNAPAAITASGQDWARVCRGREYLPLDQQMQLKSRQAVRYTRIFLHLLETKLTGSGVILFLWTFIISPVLVLSPQSLQRSLRDNLSVFSPVQTILSL